MQDEPEIYSFHSYVSQEQLDEKIKKQSEWIKSDGPKTSNSGGGNFVWKTATTAPEEPDPENLGKRIRNLTKDEAKQLYYYLRCKYKIQD